MFKHNEWFEPYLDYVWSSNKTVMGYIYFRSRLSTFCIFSTQFSWLNRINMGLGKGEIGVICTNIIWYDSTVMSLFEMVSVFHAVTKLFVSLSFDLTVSLDSIVIPYPDSLFPYALSSFLYFPFIVPGQNSTCLILFLYSLFLKQNRNSLSSSPWSSSLLPSPSSSSPS